ncbi:hypothetical protein D0B54_16645 [Solimonas sp. K1W22B-7]|uniref:hypothetical protein n=1 Tax=Solimonas sp. K1W22B-7 TaxID=2303331 RepID=UPI000E330A64|nr:hypothetical protein [Solimonas sp. K1W22B-7]AXQ30203.1 hypothetical protein D0B54_16645 [Solimonas sp. K1W22B-7]
MLLAITGSDECGQFTVILIEAVAQTIRYAPLLIWLFLLAMMQIPLDKRLYAFQTGFSGGAYARFELVGHWGPPLLVVTAFTFQDAANDHLIAQLSIRPSVAAHTELIAHALDRNFMVLLSLRSAAEAVHEIVLLGVLATFGFALIFGLLAVMYVFLAKWISSPAFDSRNRAVREAETARVWPAFAVAVMVLGFFGYTLSGLRPGDLAGLAPLWKTGLLSAAAALLSWMIAATLVYWLRDGLDCSDGSAPRGLGLASTVAIAVGYVPPLSLAVAVFGFAFLGGFESEGAGAWWLFVAQVLRFFPIVFVLLVPAALSIQDKEIRYLKNSGASVNVRGIITFLMPNIVVHLAVAAICFNLILNEGVIASVFQAQIPSMSDIMSRATTGRSANYSLAGMIVLSQAAFFSMFLWVWGRASIFAWRLRHAD